MDWLRAQPDDLDRLLEEVRAAGVESVTVVAAPEDVAASRARWPVAEDRGQVGTTVRSASPSCASERGPTRLRPAVRRPMGRVP